MNKVLFIDTTHKYLIDQLEKKNIVCDFEFSKTKSQIEKIIAKYDGIVIRSRFKIDKKFIDAAKKLKFIARAGSGLENIDIKYAEQKKIKCINAAEGNKQAVAEHALALILNLFNKINQANNELKSGKWLREENRGIELSGKKIGIIGFGNTGSSFVNLLKNFDLELLVYDKYKQNYEYKSSLKEIFEKAEILSLHVPLNDETKKYIDKSFINKMKKPFYLINTSRGQCVDTKALIRGIKENKVKGACLDVFEHEKTSFEKLKRNRDLTFLLNSNKTILTPHIAGWTTESYFKIAKILSEKIISELS
ncbi:MAG: hydroxyacid dehydrogenase [Flavobacteriales bacterium]|nr:hydroxyacid dehydrogenase [Flavobacteriales bacterium]|tara:strand:- start:2491 stop:3411 length:921 start_codon:yes stop_codon:yes gene_type:complete